LQLTDSGRGEACLRTTVRSKLRFPNGAEFDVDPNTFQQITTPKRLPRSSTVPDSLVLLARTPRLIGGENDSRQ